MNTLNDTAILKVKEVNGLPDLASEHTKNEPLRQW